MNSEQALARLIERLEEERVDSMVVGAMSSNLYGVPRATDDADVVVSIGHTSAIGPKSTARRTCSRSFVVKLPDEGNRSRRGVHFCDGGLDSSANAKSFFAADFTSAVRPLVFASVYRTGISDFGGGGATLGSKAGISSSQITTTL